MPHTLQALHKYCLTGVSQQLSKIHIIPITQIQQLKLRVTLPWATLQATHEIGNF